MDELNRNVLEAAKLQRIAADAEKERADEKYLKACRHRDSLIKEAGEAKRQLQELEVCEGT